MISKISPSFTGKVRLGRNPYDRRKMNETLKEVPPYKRADFTKSVMLLKSAIEGNTPYGSEYLINIASFNNGYLAGTNVSVTDINSNKHVGLGGVLKIFNGEPVSMEQYDKDMKCAFQTIALDVVKKAQNEDRYGAVVSGIDKLV